MKSGLRCGELMTTNPVSVTPYSSIADCARTMKKNHVGSLLVMEGRRLYGIITEQDIVRKLVAKDKNPLDYNAKDIMSEIRHTVTSDTDVFDAILTMRDNNIRHLPVTEEGQLAGLVTSKDILKVEPDLFELLAERIELKEERKLDELDREYGLL